MKPFVFFLLMSVCTVSFSQNKDEKGTVTVRKNSDTLCKASILGYSGEMTIVRNELLKATELEVNKNCNYEIVSFTMSFFNSGVYADYTIKGSSFTKECIYKLKTATKILIDNIKVLNKNTNQQIHLESIVLKITD